MRSVKSQHGSCWITAAINVEWIAPFLPFLQLKLLSRGWWAFNLPPVSPKFLKTIKLLCPSKVIKLGIGEKYFVSSLPYWEWFHCVPAVVQTTLPGTCCSKCCILLHVPYCIRVTFCALLPPYLLLYPPSVFADEGKSWTNLRKHCKKSNTLGKATITLTLKNKIFGGSLFPEKSNF